MAALVLGECKLLCIMLPAVDTSPYFIPRPLQKKKIGLGMRLEPNLTSLLMAYGEAPLKEPTL